MILILDIPEKKMKPSTKTKKHYGAPVEKFGDRKKNAVMREYRKILKKDKYKQPSTAFQESRPGVSQIMSEKPKKLTAFQKAMQECNNKQNLKQRQKEEKERRQKERNEALARYKAKKKEKFRRLSKKTKWGQPIMKDRIEMLLEKIKKQVEEA